MKKQTAFKTGDIVICREHQNKMTVRKQTNSQVTCTWFDENNKLHQKDFYENELQIAKQ